MTRRLLLSPCPGREFQPGLVSAGTGAAALGGLGTQRASEEWAWAGPGSSSLAGRQALAGTLKPGGLVLAAHGPRQRWVLSGPLPERLRLWAGAGPLTSVTSLPTSPAQSRERLVQGEAVAVGWVWGCAPVWAGWEVLVPSGQGPRGDNCFAFWHLLQEARLCLSLTGAVSPPRAPAPTHTHTCSHTSTHV